MCTRFHRNVKHSFVHEVIGLFYSFESLHSYNMRPGISLLAPSLTRKQCNPSCSVEPCELIYPFFQSFEYQTHLIPTLALNPIGHRRFDMNVCDEGCKLFAFEDFLQKCLETSQGFLGGFFHLTGNNKGMWGCRNHEWLTTELD